MQSALSIPRVPLPASLTSFMVSRSKLGALFKGHKPLMVHCGFPTRRPHFRRRLSPNTSLVTAPSAPLAPRFLSSLPTVTNSEIPLRFPQETPTLDRV